MDKNELDDAMLPPDFIGRRYITMYPYVARNPQDLTFDKGEIIEIDEDIENDLWWHGYSLTSKKSGFVPSNYLEELNSLSSKE